MGLFIAEIFTLRKAAFVKIMNISSRLRCNLYNAISPYKEYDDMKYFLRVADGFFGVVKNFFLHSALKLEPTTKASRCVCVYVDVDVDGTKVRTCVGRVPFREFDELASFSFVPRPISRSFLQFSFPSKAKPERGTFFQFPA